jgi:hypothetical protein
MNSAFLGEVPLKPTRATARFLGSHYRLGQIACCEIPDPPGTTPPGGVWRFCYDQPAPGVCNLVTQTPGFAPQPTPCNPCGGAGAPPPAQPPPSQEPGGARGAGAPQGQAEPPIEPSFEPSVEPPIQPSLEPPVLPSVQPPIPTVGPPIEVSPGYTVPSIPTGAFPGEPFGGVYAPVRPARMPVRGRLPCPTAPLKLEEWTTRCGLRRRGLVE